MVFGIFYTYESTQLTRAVFSIRTNPVYLIAKYSSPCPIEWHFIYEVEFSSFVQGLMPKFQ